MTRTTLTIRTAIEAATATGVALAGADFVGNFEALNEEGILARALETARVDMGLFIDFDDVATFAAIKAAIPPAVEAAYTATWARLEAA